MTHLNPGDEIEYTITYLEMSARPSYPRPSLPVGPPTALIAAHKPPAWYFLSLYDAVGQGYEWTDRHEDPTDELEGFLYDPQVTLYTLMRTGWPAGFFILDARSPATCDLSYFGLVPQAIGLNLGTYLLQTAIHAAWDRDGVERVTVSTNSLDHPRALPLYQKSGFTPVRQEKQSRVLTRPRDIRP